MFRVERQPYMLRHALANGFRVLVVVVPGQLRPGRRDPMGADEQARVEVELEDVPGGHFRDAPEQRPRAENRLEDQIAEDASAIDLGGRAAPCQQRLLLRGDP